MILFEVAGNCLINYYQNYLKYYLYLCRIGIIIKQIHIEGKTSGKRFWQLKTYAHVINVILALNKHDFIRRPLASFGQLQLHVS